RVVRVRPREHVRPLKDLLERAAPFAVLAHADAVADRHGRLRGLGAGQVDATAHRAPALGAAVEEDRAAARVLAHDDARKARRALLRPPVARAAHRGRPRRAGTGRAAAGAAGSRTRCESAIPTATAAFSDSTPAKSGIDTWTSLAARSASDAPVPSLPTASTRAEGPREREKR